MKEQEQLLGRIAIVDLAELCRQISLVLDASPNDVQIAKSLYEEWKAVIQSGDPEMRDRLKRNMAHFLARALSLYITSMPERL
jgi:hypothetical protein